MLSDSRVDDLVQNISVTFVVMSTRLSASSSNLKYLDIINIVATDSDIGYWYFIFKRLVNISHIKEQPKQIIFTKNYIKSRKLLEKMYGNSNEDGLTLIDLTLTT
jgi:hypothetical protein